MNPLINSPVYILSKVPGFNQLLNTDVSVDVSADDNDNDTLTKFVCTNYTKTGKNYKILHYDKSMLNNDLIPTFGLIRSVIVNPNGQVVCFSPPKSFNADAFITLFPQKKEDIVAEEFVEGTMINVFWDQSIGINGSFEIATRNTVGADVVFFKKPEPKTFKSMFLEACECAHLDINSLNKEYCYSFVLQHPDNRIVVPFSSPQLYLVAVYKIIHFNSAINCESSDKFTDLVNYNNNNEIHVLPVDLDIVKSAVGWQQTDVKFPQKYTEWSSYSELIDKYASPNTVYNVLGVVIKNVSTGMRCKIRNPIYEEVRQLRGNQPKGQYQYLTLRPKGKVSEFLKYYPEFKNEFSAYRDQLHMFTNNLYRNYVSCYIKKEKPLLEFPVQYRTHMYKIHEHYINDLKPENKYVTNTVVIEFVNKLLPAHQMHSLNYNVAKHAVDCIKA